MPLSPLPVLIEHQPYIPRNMESQGIFAITFSARTVFFLAFDQLKTDNLYLKYQSGQEGKNMSSMCATRFVLATLAVVFVFALVSAPSTLAQSKPQKIEPAT